MDLDELPSLKLQRYAASKFWRAVYSFVAVI